MSTPSLSAQFLEAVAFEDRMPKVVDSYRIGVADGAAQENARLAPIHSAVAEALDALEREAKEKNCVCSLIGYVGKEPPCETCQTKQALARLAEVLAKREGGAMAVHSSEYPDEPDDMEWPL